MDNGQNNEISANSEQEVSSATVPLNDNTQEKRFEKLVKFKKGFLAAFLAFLAIPFLLDDLSMENTDAGSVIFVLSIILIAICGIGYIFTLIKSMLLKKKANLFDTDLGFQKKEILCLPILIALYSLAAFIADGLFSTMRGFMMLEIYFVIAFVILIIDLLMGNVKETLKNKAVQISLIAFVPEFVLATLTRISVLPVFAVCALLTSVTSIILYKKPGRLTDNPFTKKQFQRCFAATTAAFVLFGALSVVSPIVTAKRIDKMSLKLTDDLAEKIFVTDDTDTYYRAFVFDTDGKYCYVTEDGNESDSHSISAGVDWFGFGAFRSTSLFDAVSYDKEGNAVSLIRNNYGSTKTVYSLSDSVPCFKHEFGEYVILKEAVSCQEPGSRKRICEKCGYEEISKIEGTHNYSNGICTLCGVQATGKLYDYMMSLDEYRAAYKASGMPVSKDLIDMDMGDTCMPYKDDSTNTVVFVRDKNSDFKEQVSTSSAIGKNLGYDFMLGPVLLYLKNIPGAITDIDEIVRRWDEVETRTTFRDELNAEFEEKGITYTRTMGYSTGGMVITVSVNPNYSIE